ncbi:MAG: ABC transporter permease, partial [Clostridia bacterium]|nr:ABC transporter permease [Clostridia bacterium]
MTGRTRDARPIAAAPHMVWAVLFIIAPLIFVAVYSFRGADGGFSFENFAALGDYTDAFVRSASYSLIATVICLVIGYPLAYAIS